MSADKVEVAMNDRLKLAIGAIPVLWNGIDYPDGNPDEFFRVTVLRARGQNISFTRGLFRGEYIVRHNKLTGGGVIATTATAQGIADHFNALRKFPYDGGIVTIAEPASVLGSETIDGFIVTPVSVPFTFNG